MASATGPFACARAATTFTDDVCDVPIDGFARGADAWDRAMVRLDDLRATRDARAATDALRRLEAGCRSTDNIVPLMLDAVAADATIGEIGTVYRETFGRWDAPVRW